MESQLIRHRAGYFLGPHSDLYTKLVVLLIYLAPDESAAHLGTSLYRPKDPGFTCPNSAHYPFEDFVRVKTAPYKPNSLLAFLRSDVSFHGVEPLSEQDVTACSRDLIQYVLLRQAGSRGATSRSDVSPLPKGLLRELATARDDTQDRLRLAAIRSGRACVARGRSRNSTASACSASANDLAPTDGAEVFADLSLR